MDERAQRVFADVIGEGDLTVLLLDGAGCVTAGIYVDSLGRDVSSEIGAALGAIGTEASQAMRHLPLGHWRAISCECEDANLAIAPSDGDDVVVVAAAPGVPMGFVRRLLDHAAQRALAWREEVA
jgi:predicted regulator of Ras-like GTPase activity (Roadblock/LC7/MglB family)